MASEGTDAAHVHDDEQSNEPLGVASIVLGVVGLFVGIVMVFGIRGIALALGLVALILGGTGLRRATNAQERGTAYGGLALGALTLAVGIVVVSRA
jgi:uncharacterized membrane protein HdeD (DUF308 family)